MSFWEQVFATVVGGLALTGLLAVFGWLFTRARAKIRPRPAFRLYRQRHGDWRLERVARRPAYDVELRLSHHGRYVALNRPELKEPFLDRQLHIQLPNELEFDGLEVRWRDSPILMAAVYTDGDNTSYDVVRSRPRRGLKRWLRRLLR